MELGELYVYFLAIYNFIGIFPSGDAKNDREISEKVLNQRFLAFFYIFRAQFSGFA